jgi:hypothetical protein
MVVSGTGVLRKQIGVHLYAETIYYTNPVLGVLSSLTLGNIYPSLQWQIQTTQNLLYQNPFIPARPNQFASILPSTPICSHPVDDIARTVEVLLLWLLIALDSITFHNRTFSQGYLFLFRLTSLPMFHDWIFGHKNLHSSSNRLDQSSWADKDHSIKVGVKVHCK